MNQVGQCKVIKEFLKINQVLSSDSWPKGWESALPNGVVTMGVFKNGKVKVKSARKMEKGMKSFFPIAIVIVHMLKSQLKRVHCRQEPTHRNTALASQYTADYQMVQCFPYGQDTH